MADGRVGARTAGHFACKEEVDDDDDYYDHVPFMHLPKLESPNNKEANPLQNSEIMNLFYNDPTLDASRDHPYDCMSLTRRPLATSALQQLHQFPPSLLMMQEHSISSTSIDAAKNAVFNASANSSCTTTLNSAINMGSACDDSFIVNTSSLDLAESASCLVDEWGHILDSLPKDLRLYHHPTNTAIGEDCLIGTADLPSMPATVSHSLPTRSHQLLSDQCPPANNCDADIWNSLAT